MFAYCASQRDLIRRQQDFTELMYYYLPGENPFIISHKT